MYTINKSEKRNKNEKKKHHWRLQNVIQKTSWLLLRTDKNELACKIYLHFFFLSFLLPSIDIVVLIPQLKSVTPLLHIYYLCYECICWLWFLVFIWFVKSRITSQICLVMALWQILRWNPIPAKLKIRRCVWYDSRYTSFWRKHYQYIFVLIFFLEYTLIYVMTTLFKTC